MRLLIKVLTSWLSWLLWVLLLTLAFRPWRPFEEPFDVPFSLFRIRSPALSEVIWTAFLPSFSPALESPYFTFAFRKGWSTFFPLSFAFLSKGLKRLSTIKHYHGAHRCICPT